MGNIVKLKEQKHLISCLLVTAVACFGCGGDGGDASSRLGKDVKMVVIVSRSLNTGRFQAFEIKDPIVMEKMRQAMQADLKHLDNRSDLGLGMSVNHLVVLQDKQGNTTSFEILGNDFIIVDSRRYQASRTIKALNKAHDDGSTVLIGAEQVKRLPASVQCYLK